MKELSIEEKELLLKDISGRLQSGLKVCCINLSDEMPKVWDLIGIPAPHLADILVEGSHRFAAVNIEESIRPYLRPLSSMTEEEKDYIKNVARFKQSDGIHYDDGVHYVPIYQETLDDQWKTDGKFPPILGDIYRFMLEYGYILLIDFFNSHHLDYRGLIPKGLALEAPEGMYN